MDRRDMLRLGAKTLIALPGLATLVPASYFVFAPTAATPGKLIRISLGSISLLSQTPSRKDFIVTRNVEDREKIRTHWVWARLDDNGHPLVFSPICPHAGCPVAWREDIHQFQCPCHMSTFADDGKWISGPSPTDLVQLDAEVVNGEVIIVVRDLN